MRIDGTPPRWTRPRMLESAPGDPDVVFAI
jgi:hypothetical protein